MRIGTTALAIFDKKNKKSYYSQMKTTSVTRLKNHLSAQLKEVAAGETILITDRSKPIATLQPLAHGGGGDDVSALCAWGIVSPPQKPLAVASLLKKPRGEGVALTPAILEERAER